MRAARAQVHPYLRPMLQKVSIDIGAPGTFKLVFYRGYFQMLIHEMNDDDCRAALSQMDFGRLACVRDNQPYIIPVNFLYDGRYLYGITTLGQKIEWMRANPLVCVETDERTTHRTWISIVVFGRYEELPDTPEYQRARSHALEVLQRRTLWWEPACVPPERRERRPPIFYRISIERVTGRRAVPDAIEAASP